MKFAVITDIHGNAPALKAVLNDIDAKEVEQIFCLGDLIGIGHQTNEVLEMLFSRDNISYVSGNHDESVLALLKGEAYPEILQGVKAHHEWIAEGLNPTFIPQLEKIPRSIQKTIEGSNCFFTHYYIEPVKKDVHISKDPFHNIVEPSLKNMENLFQNKNDCLICFGHHHPLHFFKGEKTTYLNPGALGCNRKPTAPYAIVTIENNALSVQIEEVEYDKTDFLLDYEKLKVPERKFILEIFHGK